MITIEEALRYTPGKDFSEGHVFLLDKPLGWTSFNVVGKVKHALRHYLGQRVKVGHAGTLDPLATGLVVVCVGRATRLAGVLTAEDKAYEATFTLGAKTASYDLETPVEAGYPTEHITPEMIYQAAAKLTGQLSQRPPLFSAKRVDGKRAYQMARHGVEHELDPVDITINSFEITEINANKTVKARINCSKGTYIRALARDFGEALGSAAYLSALRRTQSGQFLLDNAISIQELEAFLKSIAPQYAT